MTLPTNVLNQAHIRAPKGIVYGPPGIGKTTFGAGAHRPLIVDCENGAAHVTCDRTPYLSNWPAIRQWLDALALGGHGYKSVVIDSVDWLLRRLEEHVSGVNGDECKMAQTMNRSHGGYGNGKQVLKNYVYQYLLPTLDRIVNSDVAVVLLAHAAWHEVKPIDGGTAEKVGPDVHPDLVTTMIEWSDFVAAARKDANNAREMILNETANQLAKNRYGIRDNLPLTWDALMGAVYQSQPSASQPQPSHGGAPVSETNPNPQTEGVNANG